MNGQWPVDRWPVDRWACTSLGTSTLEVATWMGPTRAAGPCGVVPLLFSASFRILFVQLIQVEQVIPYNKKNNLHICQDYPTFIMDNCHASLENPLQQTSDE